MIIDYILDKRDYPDVKGTLDMKYVLEEAELHGFDYIVDAVYSRDNKRIQDAFCRYIDKQKYNPKIKGFVMGYEWFPNDDKVFRLYELNFIKKRKKCNFCGIIVV